MSMRLCRILLELVAPREGLIPRRVVSSSFEVEEPALVIALFASLEVQRESVGQPRYQLQARSAVSAYIPGEAGKAETIATGPHSVEYGHMGQNQEAVWLSGLRQE